MKLQYRHTSHDAVSRDIIKEWREASDRQEREPTQSESAEFAEGDSTRVKSLD